MSLQPWGIPWEAPDLDEGGEPSSNGPGMSLATVARLRQGAYRLFSQSLLYPDQERTATLCRVARELMTHDQGWSSFSFFPQWAAFLRALERLGNSPPEVIQGESLSLFVVGQEPVPCPPYEAAYQGGDPAAVGWLLAQLEREYAQAGVQPSPTLNEPPDHVAVELEFMSFLCGKEAEAWESRNLEEARSTLRRERAFLDAHLGRWFPGFARRVASEDGGGWFVAQVTAAATFLVHEEDLVGVILHSYDGVTGMEAV